MKLSPNALKVLEKRYFRKDEAGNPIEDAEGMFRRVAHAVAKADEQYVSEEEVAKTEETFYDMLTNLEFLPNSPTLMNAGRPLGQLSACFVLPIEDTMEGIFETIKNSALIHKSGGGTGFSFSKLRSKGSTVNSTGGVASGPVSFLKVFNAATEAVKQGGTRRGANMGIMRVDHPDILEFISCKSDNAEITNFNISIGITNKFLKAYISNTKYDLIDPSKNNVTGQLNAKEVFDLIINMAWKNGEPGIIFIDRINKDNVTPGLGEIESTNPCGEQPLLPYEACNLGSINLAVMLKNTSSKLEIDFEKLEQTVRNSVHFLDNVIDVNKYPIPQIDEMTRGTRKIGLGVMGFADLLCKLNIPYNSPKAVVIAEKVMHFIQEKSKNQSTELAEQRGVFPYFDESIYKELGLKLRNATTTTIAPTGTISLIAGVSSGIEPLFAISYIRNIMDNNEMVEVNPLFKQIAMVDGFYSENLMKRIAKKGTLKDIQEIPKSIQSIFVTSHDITPEWHVKMQAGFQKHTDNAVSKTVNLKHDATPNDVKDVFIHAYKTNCKGVTIYRDGSRDMQVLNIGKVKGKNETATNKLEQETPIEEVSACSDCSFEQELSTNNDCKRVEPRSRPEITTGITEKVKIGCGNLYVTVNYDENGICEVFTNTGRAGGCPSQSEATSRLVSIALRSGIDAKSIVEQLKGIRCPSTIRQNQLKVMSCPDAIGRLIEKVLKLQSPENENLTKDSNLGFNIPSKIESKTFSDKIKDIDNSMSLGNVGGLSSCPECATPVEHEGGCVVCRNCGYSKCG